MRTMIGIYGSHDEALNAVKELKKEGFPVEKLSLISKKEVTEDHIRVRSNKPLEAIGITIGAVVGPVVGALMGAGLFTIPGLGFLFGAGILVGALAGLDFGIICGGLITIFTAMGIKKEYTIRSEEHLKDGKTILVAEGSEKEINRERDFLRHNVLV